MTQSNMLVQHLSTSLDTHYWVCFNTDDARLYSNVLRFGETLDPVNPQWKIWHFGSCQNLLLRQAEKEKKLLMRQVLLQINCKTSCIVDDGL